MQKRKNLIKLLIIFSTILIIIGIIATVYLKTDLLKSKKQIFYKYLFCNQILEILPNKIDDNMKSYSSTGNIEFIYDYNNEIETMKQDEIAQNIESNVKKLEKIQELTGNIESKVDKTNQKEYHNINLKKDDKKIMNIEFVRDNDKYAFKSKQLVNAYIGLENNNITDLANKMGIENTENLPEKIDLSKIYEALFEISKDEKEHIIETYKNIMIQEVEDKNYEKKEKQNIIINNSNYVTNMYSLTLSKAESIDLAIKMLETLKEDSITLNLITNKVKTINQNSEYTNINKVHQKIEEYIGELKALEKTENEFIRIDLYINKNQVKKIDFSFENQKQISFEYEEKDGKKILQISQDKFIDEESAIIYNLCESLQKTKQIKIIKEKDITTYSFIMYNVKDIYKKILEDAKTVGTDETNGENSQKQTNIEEIEKIYNQYKMMNDEFSQISFNIQLNNNSKPEGKSQIGFYISAYNSKIGINITSEKKYEDKIETGIDLNSNNSVMLNEYQKEKINKLFDILFNKTKKILGIGV